MSEAQGWMTEYNRLIEEPKVVYERNGHIQVLQKLRHAGDTLQLGEGVGTAAGSLSRIMSEDQHQADLCAR
jgi:hypothetical protein